MNLPSEKLAATDAERDARIMKIAHAEGYRYLKVMANGEIAGLFRFLFTVGLVVGIDETGYRTRYCFERGRESLESLTAWDGIGDPPGHWIKEKSRLGERDNPHLFAGIPVVVEPR